MRPIAYNQILNLSNEYVPCPPLKFVFINTSRPGQSLVMVLTYTAYRFAYFGDKTFNIYHFLSFNSQNIVKKYSSAVPASGHGLRVGVVMMVMRVSEVLIMTDQKMI